MDKISTLVILFLLSGIVQSCAKEDGIIKINSSHLDYLYEEITLNGIDMAFVHIYSNHPEYNYIDDDDEGTACIDDAARAAIFYLNHYRYTGNNESLIKNKKLLKFVLYLQSENGYFYNFMWKDLSINKTFKTSVAEPNWWSWRALWVLTESLPIYEDRDPEFALSLKDSIEKIVDAIKNDIPDEINYHDFNGIECPAWLPNKYAADQASVLLLGLNNYYDFSKDDVIKNYIGLLCQGIINMQMDDKTNEYYGAFLSWQNTWHAWGNLQAYALLKSYKVLSNEKVLNSALNELNNFYPVLMENGYLNNFSVEAENSEIRILDQNKFSQIAYNIRPMIYALLEANKITNDPKYSILAGKIGKWFSGKNAGLSQIYNPDNGIVFDGINSENNINMNSGAESTIEALLSLLEISNDELASSTYLSK